MGFESRINTEAYIPDFDVRETRTSTEELPILLLSYAGVSFIATLDLRANTFSVEHSESANDTDPVAVARLATYAHQIAQTELNSRRDVYSQHFA